MTDGRTWIVALCATLAGCAPMGSVSVRLEDAPGSTDALLSEGIVSVNLPIQGVEARMEGEEAFTPLAAGPDAYNLLDFQPDGSAEVYDMLALSDGEVLALDEVAPGDIAELRIVLMEGVTPFVVDADEHARALHLSPDIAEDLSFRHTLTITAGDETDVTLAMDLDASVTRDENNVFWLAPVFDLTVE